MFGSRVLGAVGAVCLSAMGAQAATVDASLTGDTVLELGEVNFVIAKLEVTPRDTPYADVFGTMRASNWDRVVVSIAFDAGNGETESVNITDTPPATPNDATPNPFDFETFTLFPDFTTQYTAPGTYTQSINGSIRFFEERTVEVFETQCTGGVVIIFGGSGCLVPKDVPVGYAERDVMFDSATFSASRTVTVPAPVPLPAPALLLLAGLGGLAGMRRRT